MNKTFIISFILSLIFHLPVILNFDWLRPKKSQFSKINLKNSQAKATIYYKEIVTAPTPPKKTSGKKKLVKKTIKSKKSKPIEKAIKEKTLQGQNTLLEQYLTLIRNEIAKIKRYPRVAKRLGQQGDVIVKFNLIWPGSIEQVEIKSASEYKLLNQSAIEAINELKKLPPMPKELEGKSFTVQISIIYRLI